LAINVLAGRVAHAMLSHKSGCVVMIRPAADDIDHPPLAVRTWWSIAVAAFQAESIAPSCQPLQHVN
jgi:hypothetical protein